MGGGGSSLSQYLAEYVSIGKTLSLPVKTQFLKLLAPQLPSIQMMPPAAVTPAPRLALNLSPLSLAYVDQSPSNLPNGTTASK